MELLSSRDKEKFLKATRKEKKTHCFQRNDNVSDSWLWTQLWKLGNNGKTSLVSEEKTAKLEFCSQQKYPSEMKVK